MNNANQGELKIMFCDLCNCNHGINSATCLRLEFELFEKASDDDLKRFEDELEIESD